MYVTFVDSLWHITHGVYDMYMYMYVLAIGVVPSTDPFVNL